MITFAKGVTNGAVPMGGVIVSNKIHDAFMSGPEHAIELFHGNTYSGHPLACAAGLATLDLYRDEGLFERARKMERVLEEAVHSLKGAPLRRRHPQLRPGRRHRHRAGSESARPARL